MANDGRNAVESAIDAAKADKKNTWVRIAAKLAKTVKRWRYIVVITVAWAIAIYGLVGCTQQVDRTITMLEKVAARVAEDQTFYHSVLSASGTLHDPAVRVSVGMEYYVIVRAEGVHGQVSAQATGKEKGKQ